MKKTSHFPLPVLDNFDEKGIKRIFFSNPLALEDLLTETVVVNWHLGHRDELEGQFLEHRSEVFVSS